MIELDDALTDILTESLCQQRSGETYHGWQRLGAVLRDHQQRAMIRGRRVLLVKPVLRSAIRQHLRYASPTLPVLSYSEIPVGVSLTCLSRVTLAELKSSMVDESHDTVAVHPA